MRILITGASGFIGQALVQALHGTHELHAVYEMEASKAKNPQIPDERKQVCDLRDTARVEEIVGRIRPEVVLHLAARSEVANSFANYLEVGAINYLGTVALAEANRKHNPSLRVFVMASTMETYGHHSREEGAFTEETEQRPMAPYAVAKLACEKYLAYMRYAYRFPYVVLRQTNSYGRHDNDFFVMERIITQMLRGDVCRLGDPDPWRNFLWIGDLVRLYEVLLERHEEVLGEAFVTGPDNALSIRDLAWLARRRLSWDGRIEWHTRPKLPGEIYYLNSNPMKAEKLLGWRPQVDLYEGIDRTAAIWRENFGRG